MDKQSNYIKVDCLEKENGIISDIDKGKEKEQMQYKSQEKLEEIDETMTERASFRSIMCDVHMENLVKNGTEHLLECLRHRLKISEVKNVKDNQFDIDDLSDDESNDLTEVQSGVYDDLMTLIRSQGITAHLEINRLLLQRRSAAPWIYPKSSPVDETLFNSAKAFCNIIISTGKDQECNISTDKSLLRVVAINLRKENQSQLSDLLTLFGINSMYSHSNSGVLTKESIVIEIGIGFIKNDLVATPFMLLHVIGDYIRATSVLKSIANVILIEADDISKLQNIKECLYDEKIRYAIWDPTKPMEKIKLSKELFNHHKITGTCNKIKETLFNYLQQIVDKTKQNLSIPINEVNFPGASTYQTVFDVKLPDLLKTRPENFPLQCLYIEESDLLRKLDDYNVQHQDGSKQILQSQIRNIQKKRNSMASEIYNSPLVKILIRILMEKDPETRVMKLWQFEELLHIKSDEATEKLRIPLQEALSEYINCKDKTDPKNFHKRYLKLHEEYLSIRIGVEHVWRELSHIYTSDFETYAHLPELAARHLLDGFVIELLDGDAGFINQEWMSAILHHLQSVLKESKIFVLSILGSQSSGKSTLLNLMFGVKLHTSVGRCTKGINMMLIESKMSSMYNYVLILDTEGVRAPEFQDDVSSIWRDNRLATFSIIPADATIILINGENTSYIVEILPIVKHVYKKSALAETYGQHAASYLTFVFNRIDTSKSGHLDQVRQSLIKQLKEFSTEDDCSEVKVLSDRATLSDIKTFGQLNKGDIPPEDIPNCEYGANVIELRKHIEESLNSRSFEAKSIESYSSYLENVAECLDHSNFDLSFKTILEKQMYLDYQTEYCRIRSDLSKSYNTQSAAIQKSFFKSAESKKQEWTAKERHVLEKDLHCMRTKELRDKVQPELTKCDKEMKELLIKFPQWKTTGNNDWNSHKDSILKGCDRELLSVIAAALIKTHILDQKKQELVEKIREMFKTKDKIHYHELETEFKKLFDRYVAELSETYPSMTNNEVKNLINNQYSLHKEIADYFKTSKAYTIKDIVDYLRTSKDNTNNFTKLFRVFKFSKPKENVFEFPTEEELLKDFVLQIYNETKSCDRFSENVVRDVIENTKDYFKMKNKFSRGNIVKGHKLIKEIIIENLTEAQQKWDSLNSVSGRFKECETSMWEYFQQIAKGTTGFKLYEGILQTNLFSKTGFLPLVYEEIIEEVITQTRNARWSRDRELLQIYIDLETIKKLENNLPCDAIKYLANNPVDWAIKDLIQKIIDNIQHKVFDTCKHIVKESLSKSIRDTLNIEKRIIVELNKNINRELNRNIKSSWQMDLSQIANTLVNECDLNVQHIKQDSFSNKLINNLPTFQDINTDLKEGTKKTLHKIITKLKNTNVAQELTIPCPAVCPVCKSRCTRTASHVQHDTIHQPAGLVGVHYIKTDVLDYETCDVMVRNKGIFILDTKRIPLENWTEHFTDWMLPGAGNKSLKLRKYVMYNYGEEISKMYNRKKPEQVPLEYDTNLQILKKSLEAEKNRLIK